MPSAPSILAAHHHGTVTAGQATRGSGVAGAGGVVREARPGVGAVVDLDQAVLGDLGVELGGGEAGVAEQLLDAADVGATGEQVGRERWAQDVRGDLVREADTGGVAAEELPGALAGDAGAAGAEEQGGAAGEGGQGGAATDEVGLDGGAGGAADGDQPF